MQHDLPPGELTSLICFAALIAFCSVHFLDFISISTDYILSPRANLRRFWNVSKTRM